MSAETPTPIFVDDSGRRHRTVRAVGWVTGVLMVAYLALLGVSLVGGPGLLPFSLPAIGRVLPDPAAPLIVSGGTGKRPSELLPAPTPTPTTAAAPETFSGSAASPGTGRSRTRPGTTTSPTRHPTSTSHPTAKPHPSATPTDRHTPSPSHRPTTHPKPHARPSPTPTP